MLELELAEAAPDKGEVVGEDVPAEVRSPEGSAAVRGWPFAPLGCIMAI